MKKIPVKLGAASYNVLIANGLLREAGPLIVRGFERRPSLCVVISSPRIWSLWGEKLSSSLKSAGLAFAVLKIPDGEQQKNLRTVEALLQSMTAAHADRESIVVAFGGGVVGDVAGFTAAIYMRGIPYVQVPTTLLAQVDASVGGKTGVNLRAGKNLAGAFHQPAFVAIDPAVLSTLPERELRSGFFEVIKCGVIRDARLFASIERNAARGKQWDPRFLMSAIESAVRVKAAVVSKDEKESGLRRILNFGHTIGHALEAHGEYKKLLHGEAVAWGMIAAAEIGAEMQITSRSVAQRITHLVLRCGPLPEMTASSGEVLRLIQSDKKTLHGVPHFVLATQIGRTAISGKVSDAIIRKVMARMKALSGAGR